MGNQAQKNKRPIGNHVRQVYQAYRQSLRYLRSKRKSERLHSSQQAKLEAIDKLFQSFGPLKYSWAEQIFPMFYKHFYQGFENVWMTNRQQFYQHLLLQSHGITTSCIGADKSDINRLKSKQQYFFKEGPGKSRGSVSQIKIRHNQESISVINNSILQEGDSFPQCVKLSFNHPSIQLQPKNHKQYYETEFYVQSSSRRIESTSYQKSEYSVQKIENSSVIIPETVFIDRLTEECKTEIDQLVSFYRAFSNTLQQVINSTSLISCPLKHFQASMREKVQRKKIRKTKMHSSTILFTNDRILRMRHKRCYNTNVLLLELRDFNEAYSEFIWKYLNLDRMAETFVGTLITFDTVYNVVLKSVWAVTGWIGQRGFEWQQAKLPQILPSLQIPSNLQLPKSVILQAELLTMQHNPLKYLKKIVIIYRQVSRFCPNADKLLVYYQKLFHEVISNGKHGGIFRMRNIIDKLIRIDQTNGQICYAWTTWNVIIEMLKSKVEELGQRDLIERQFIIIQSC